MPAMLSETTAAFAFLVGNVFSDPKHSAYALICIAASYPIYLTVTRYAAKRSSAPEDS